MNHEELFELIRGSVKQHGHDAVLLAVSSAHNGRLIGFVNNENLHLVRRYRNQVSGSASRLLQEAGV